MRSVTLWKYISIALVVLWAIVVPTSSSQALQELPPRTAHFWSITMGTDEPFQPITITVAQTKDKSSYLAYGRTPKFFFEVQCTAADAPSSIDPDRARSSVIMAGSADLLFREGSWLISDSDMSIVLIMISTPPLFSPIPKPSGFCQLYLERRSKNQENQ